MLTNPALWLDICTHLKNIHFALRQETPGALLETLFGQAGEVDPVEGLDFVAERIRNGSMKEEDLEQLLETAYRDSADKETVISQAMSYVRQKLGKETPAPLPESIVRNQEYLDSVVEQIRNGSLKEEDLEKQL